MSNKTGQQEVRGGQGPVPAKRKRSKDPERSGQPDRPEFEPNAGGIDIGAREIFVAVPPDRDPDPVRKCETFTGDLHQMAEWLVRCGITTVATVYDVLDRNHAVFGEPAGYEKCSGQAHGFS